MSTSEKYKVWLEINITHEYYEAYTCPLALALTDKMEAYFRKNNMLLRQLENNRWVILTHSIVDLDYIYFELKPTDKIFYYVSETSEEEKYDSYSIRYNTSFGVWAEIKILIDNIKEKQDIINIQIKTHLRYWEYIFIPQSAVNTENLKIKDSRNRIEFKNIEEIKWLNQSTVFRILSADKIRMNKRYDYVIQLMEDRSSGLRLISNALPHPNPDQISVTGQKNTLTVYYYL